MDAYQSWVAQLRKGVVELLVLRLLSSRGPSHGYGIVRQLAEVGGIVLGESTVYPALKRLEQDGLVSGAWVDSGEVKQRKQYEVTASGKAFLERAGEEWQSVVAVMCRLEGDAQ